MKANGTIASALVSVALAGCSVIIPPRPAPEDPYLSPESYVWKSLAINREYDFIGVTRIDCATIESTLSASGNCIPEARPYGSVYICPLKYPAKSLEFGCLDNDTDVTDTWLRLTVYEDIDVEWDRAFGACAKAGAGPAAGEDPRYPTDPGYSVCLFENAEVPGRIAGGGDDGRLDKPVGTYLDLHGYRRERDVALVFDTRFMERDEKDEAFRHVFDVFDFYRLYFYGR